MTTPDMLRIYRESVRASGLLSTRTASLIQLHEVFSVMSRTLRKEGADSFEQEFFREAIVRAIGYAPAQEMDDNERAAATATVYTAFDGLPRKTSVRATPTAFLHRVTFVDEAMAAWHEQAS